MQVCGAATAGAVRLSGLQQGWTLVLKGCRLRAGCMAGRDAAAGCKAPTCMLTQTFSVLCDYLIYVDHNMRKALELAAAATQARTHHTML